MGTTDTVRSGESLLFCKALYPGPKTPSGKKYPCGQGGLCCTGEETQQPGLDDSPGVSTAGRASPPWQAVWEEPSQCGKWVCRFRVKESRKAGQEHALSRGRADPDLSSPRAPGSLL